MKIFPFVSSVLSGPIGLPAMTSQPLTFVSGGTGCYRYVSPPPSVGSGCPFANPSIYLLIHLAYLSGLPSLIGATDLLVVWPSFHLA